MSRLLWGLLKLSASVFLIIVSIFVSLFLRNRWTFGFICGFSILLWIRLRIVRASNVSGRPLRSTAVPKIRGKLPGNLDILWQLVFDEPHEYCGESLRKWADIYGPTYDLNILFGHQIVTADPANVKHILANDFNSFGKGEKFREMFESFLGTGIFTTDGDSWKYHRAMARPFLTAERTSDFECYERNTTRALEVMLEHARKGEAFDIQDIFSRFTLDTGADFLFGRSVGSQYVVTDGRPHSSYSEFSEAFNAMSAIGTKRVRIGSWWRLFELWQDLTTKHTNIIHAFIDPIIKTSMTARIAHDDVTELTFLDYLTTATDDYNVVRDELLNLLLAARDTTASLLTFVTYILALHSDVARTLRGEIGEIVGDLREPTIADIRRMKYLRAVLNEVLRLFPPVPFNIRRCIKPSELPSPLSKTGPFHVDPGVSITYSPLLIQRRTDVWGDSASVFNPERWLTDGPRIHVTNPFAFLPFNGGPRMCLGQQFAYSECSYFVIRMLQTFSTLELAPDAQPEYSRPAAAWSRSTIDRQSVEKCWPTASLTLYAKGGLWVKAHTI